MLVRTEGERETRHVPVHCKLCPANGRCLQCRKRHTDSESKRLAKQVASLIIRLAITPVGNEIVSDPWLLADDGEYDDVAVTVASGGYRRVQLTNTERLEAAASILLNGGNSRDICKRLSLPRIVTESEWQTATQENAERLANCTG